MTCKDSEKTTAVAFGVLPEKKRNVAAIALSAAIVLVIAAFVLYAFVFAPQAQERGPRETMAADFVSAYFFNDMERLAELSQYDMYNYMEEYLDFGETAKSCTTKILPVADGNDQTVELCSKEELNTLAEQLSYKGGYENFSEACRVRVEYSVDSIKGTLGGTATITMAHFENGWLVISYEGLAGAAK